MKAGSLTFSPQVSARLCGLLLFAFFALLTHELEADHADAGQECAACIALDRLSDGAVGDSAPQVLSVEHAEPSRNDYFPAIPPDIAFPGSRGPPAIA